MRENVFPCDLNDVSRTPLGMEDNECYNVNNIGKAFNMILATSEGESSGQRIKELYLHNAQLAVSENVIYILIVNCQTLEDLYNI